MRLLFVTVTVLILSTGLTIAAQSTQQPARVEVQENLKVDAQARAALEPNTAVMESTFKIEGPNLYGSGFIVGRPYTDSGRKQWRYVLVTAAHVLNEIEGNVAVIHYRRRTVAGAWERVPMSFNIRNGTVPLWKQHPSADVAAMYISVPDGVLTGGVLSTDLLADDAALRSFAVHPGDEVACAGFPLGDESKPSGFPILRTGRIASYPLLPTTETKFFLLDFPVFPGNSGGPAYIIHSGVRGNVLYMGQNLSIVGVVSKEQVFAQRIPLGIAEVIHATLISETIALLPPPDQP